MQKRHPNLRPELADQPRAHLAPQHAPAHRRPAPPEPLPRTRLLLLCRPSTPPSI
jgi:hypothetical protein